MPSYSTPGAYVEWQDATSAVPRPLRTDVAGFAGLAARGPLDTPVPVESFRQFQSHFGSFIGGGFLAYAARAFFENGGVRCWVVRVAAAGGRPAAASSVDLPSAPGAPPRWRVLASSPGTWGDALSIAITPVAPARTVGTFSLTSRRYLDVASIAGFQRGDLIALSQPGLPTVHRVISLADAAAGRLWVVHPTTGLGLPYDQLLDGLDANQPVQIASIAYTIAVRESGRPVGFYAALSPVPEHPRYGPTILPALAPDAPPVPPAPPSFYPLLRQGSPLPSGAMRPPPPPAPITITDLADDPADLAAPIAVTTGMLLPLTGGADGLAALTTYDFIGEDSDPGDSDLVWRSRTRGLRMLGVVSEIAIVAAPDLVVQPEPPPFYDTPTPTPSNPCITCPPGKPRALVHQPLPPGESPPVFSDEAVALMQAALVEMCEALRDRVAILDALPAMATDAALGFPALVAWRQRFDTRAAALYWPWLRVVDPLGVEPTRLVPPSGHVAGIYAALDVEVGVHRAPANRTIAWAEDVTADAGEARHGALNSLGVNVIRAYPGRGIRVMGARTMSSDPTWRFINVRRLVLMVMKALDVATQWAVFEPNDAATRGRITQALAEFLGALWRRGALVGPTAEAAFQVRCDDVNNPAEARANGRLLAEIAIAPSQPYEFVVLRLGRQGNHLEIDDGGAATAPARMR